MDSGASFPPNWKPFVRHQDRWDLTERLRTFIFFLTLFPIRICAILLLLLWYYFSLRIGLFGLGHRKPSEFSRFRRNLIESAQPVARLFLFIIGFYKIEKRGDYRMFDEFGRANILVVNHTSYLDILLIMATNWEGIPSFVAKKEVMNIPIIGYKSQVWQCIYVTDRMGAKSRLGLSKLIGERGSDARSRPVVVFSEGTTTNGQSVINFHSGAFVYGHPVKPVAIRYPHKGGFSATWESISAWTHVLRLMTQWRNYAEIIWLPIYRPSEEEKADPRVYAEGVRACIANALGVPMVDASYVDKVQYHKSLKNKTN